MSSNGAPTGKEPAIGRSLSGLAHDVIELGELQSRLLLMDVRASSRRIRTTLVLAAVAAVVLLGCIPVALTSLAEYLIVAAEWTRPVAMLAATTAGLVVSGLLFGLTWARWQTGFATFDRSRDEFHHNVDWLKSNLRKKSESPNPWPSTAARFDD